jgi:predicted regulator of Ras-like GTPase activity (Roadblock/LC7/MglB family)
VSSAFGEILKRMVERVPGSLGAVFADWEGEAVDQFAHIEPVEMRLLGAHWGVILSLTRQRLAHAGPIEEFWIECERAIFLVRPVTDEYYVVLAARRSAHLALARRELERGADTLKAEM